MMRNLKYVAAAWPVMTLVTAATCFLTDTIAKWLGIELPPQPSLDAVLNSRGWYLVANIALITLIAPIAEEAVFRGLLFKLPMRFFAKFRYFGISKVLLIAVSSLLFTAAHYIQMPFPDNAFVALFLFGLIQCHLYTRTNALWCPMATHALFNLTNLVLLFLFPEAAKMS